MALLRMATIADVFGLDDTDQEASIFEDSFDQNGEDEENALEAFGEYGDQLPSVIFFGSDPK